MVLSNHIYITHGGEERTLHLNDVWVLKQVLGFFMTSNFLFDDFMPIFTLGLKINMGKQASSRQDKRNKSANNTDWYKCI